MDSSAAGYERTCGNKCCASIGPENFDQPGKYKFFMKGFTPYRVVQLFSFFEPKIISLWIQGSRISPGNFKKDLGCFRYV